MYRIFSWGLYTSEANTPNAMVLHWWNYKRTMLCLFTKTFFALLLGGKTDDYCLEQSIFFYFQLDYLFGREQAHLVALMNMSWMGVLHSQSLSLLKWILPSLFWFLQTILLIQKRKKVSQWSEQSPTHTVLVKIVGLLLYLCQSFFHATCYDILYSGFCSSKVCHQPHFVDKDEGTIGAFLEGWMILATTFATCEKQDYVMWLMITGGDFTQTEVDRWTGLK